MAKIIVIGMDSDRYLFEHVEANGLELIQIAEHDITVIDEISPYQQAVKEHKLPQLETLVIEMIKASREECLTLIEPKPAKVLPMHVNCGKVKTKRSFNKKLSRSYAKR